MPVAKTPHISVVSPCFNEELVLAEFYRRAKGACEKCTSHYEIVLVNDGSTDATGRMIDDLAHRDKHVVAVHLSRNHGQQLALTAGLSVCRGDNILIIDADLQDPPELLPSMLSRRQAGADVVYGQRRQRAGETWFKRWSAYSFYRFLNSLTDISIPRDTGDFRLVSRRVIDCLLAMPERQRFVRGMVNWIGFRQEAFLYDRDPRFAGVSKYPVGRMVKLAIDAITSFSLKPLAIASYLAAVTGLLSIGLVLYAVMSLVLGGAGSGWAILLAALSMMSSLQFVVLAIQGEYLGRLYEQSKGRPLFIIDRMVNAEPVTFVKAPERQAA